MSELFEQVKKIAMPTEVSFIRFQEMANNPRQELRITAVGEENIYFRDAWDHYYFCKCL